jgi:hypothetical protein
MRGGMDMNAGNSSTAHIIAEWEAAGSRLANEIRSLNDRKGLRKGGRRANGGVAVSRRNQTCRCFVLLGFPH